MVNIILSATQMACGWDIDDHIGGAEVLVSSAGADGAQIILLQELFEIPYFSVKQDLKYFALAKPQANHPLIQHFAHFARQLRVVLPISFFERAGQLFLIRS